MAHVEKKDVNEGRSGNTNQEAHRPDSVYNPHPFPLNPVEGDPWATAGEYKPQPGDANTNTYDNNEFYHPPHGYDMSSSDSHYPHIPMPDPTYYRYNQSHSDPPEASNEADDSEHHHPVHDSEVGHSEYPSNVETHDPTKLNEHHATSPGIKTKPNVKRLWLRLAQLVAGVGAFGFLVGAKPYSGEGIPSLISKAVVVLMYIFSAVSILVSLFFIIHYFVRRCYRNVKLHRFIIIVIDLLLGLAFGIIVFVMILHNTCKPGSRWCDFYNTSIFFGMLAFVLYAGSIFWDIVGYFVTRKRNS
jgi:hypothetical protein